MNGEVITGLSSILSSFRSSASQASAHCVIGSDPLPSWSLQAVSIYPSMRRERVHSLSVDGREPHGVRRAAGHQLSWLDQQTGILSRARPAGRVICSGSGAANL